jgi:hypothetical protein
MGAEEGDGMQRDMAFALCAKPAPKPARSRLNQIWEGHNGSDIIAVAGNIW